MKCSKRQDVQLSELVLAKGIILKIALLMEDVLQKYTDDGDIVSTSIDIYEKSGERLVYDSIDEFSKKHLLDVDIDYVTLYCHIRKNSDKLSLYTRSGKIWYLSASGEDRVEVQQALSDFSARLTSADFDSNTTESNAVLFVECTTSQNERAYRETQDKKSSKENNKRQIWANVWVVVSAVIGTIIGAVLMWVFTKQ